MPPLRRTQRLSGLASHRASGVPGIRGVLVVAVSSQAVQVAFSLASPTGAGNLCHKLHPTKCHELGRSFRFWFYAVPSLM